MEILRIQALRGPNVWSRQIHKLIQVRLDLSPDSSIGEADLRQTTTLLQQALAGDRTFDEALSLDSVPNENTIAATAQTFAHVALQLQNLAGMPVRHSDIRCTTSPHIYNVVFEYQIEEAGHHAAKAACAAVIAALAGRQPDLEADISTLRQLLQRHGPSHCVTGIIREATSRGIPAHVRGADVVLGYGKYRRTFRTAGTRDNLPGCNTLRYDEDIKPLLATSGVPVPKGAVCSGTAGMTDLIDEQGFPITIRPANNKTNAGVTENIHDLAMARRAFAEAQESGHGVVVEQYIPGADFRLLVVGGKFVAAAQRIPPFVIGDGHATIRELIDELNRRPERGENGPLNPVTFDKDTFLQLERLGYHYESVPPVGQKISLKSTATLATGATAIDVTNQVHAANRFMAERIAKLTGLKLCGIDVRAADLIRPLADSGGAVLQLTNTPSLRMHLSPSEGMPQNVAAAVLDMLFPSETPSRVPLIAITGTNGKTTTTRLLAHLAKQCGYTPGYTSTDGVYIGDYRIQSGDSSGPMSAALILQDPMVDLAILETARGGLLRSGLAFDQCDVGIVTNIQEDHLGLGDIETLDDLARVKAVVAQSIRDTGYAVLNADDDHCVRIGRELSCNIIWFSLKSDHEIIRGHVAEGGTAVVLQDQEVHICSDDKVLTVGSVLNMPLSLQGAARFMIANLLAVTGAAYAHGFTIEQIRKGLETFVPSFEQSPGRMNLFELRGFHILIDYAHNVHGLLGMKDFLQNIKARRKIGVITAVGDRRDQDILQTSEIAAEMFDHVIIRLERDLRGRTADEIKGLIIQGLKEKVTYEIIHDEAEAVCHAIEIAQPGDFIVTFSEEYRKIAGIIRQQQAQGVTPTSQTNEGNNNQPINKV